MVSLAPQVVTPLDNLCFHMVAVNPKEYYEFCAGSNLARGVSEIRDGEDL